MKEENKIYIFDTTLRDGQQTTGVNFSVSDKMTIAKSLDELGVDYIEGGWPGANPTDNDFFSRDLSFSKSKFTAFGMTRRPGRSADNDPGLNALVNSNASTICLVGKSSSFQVKSALGISEDENLLMLEDSFNYLNLKNKEAIYDAEHFFDGFKNNKEYALKCLSAAYKSSARWIVLCDTNGGTLPHEISKIVTEVTKQNSPAIAGVVSTEPAHLMNSALEGDNVVAVALKGRVPVKVVGAVRKGDVLIASNTPGHAQAAPFNGYHAGASAIGVAISENLSSGTGVVEALIK